MVLVFDKFAFGTQLRDREYNLKAAAEFINHMPQFETQQQLFLIENSTMIQQLNIQTITHLIETIQHTEYMYEKSIVETTLLSMNDIIHWYPMEHEFSLKYTTLLFVQVHDDTCTIVC